MKNVLATSWNTDTDTEYRYYTQFFVGIFKYVSNTVNIKYCVLLKNQ